MLSCRGGGQAVKASLSCPPPPEYQSKFFLVNSTEIENSECEDVSIINKSEVIFSCFSLSHYLECFVEG